MIERDGRPGGGQGTETEGISAAGDRRSHIRARPAAPGRPRTAQERGAATAVGFGGQPKPTAAAIVLRDCSLHESGDSRWVGLPGKPQADQDGHHRVDPTTGKRLYVPVVEIPDKATREKFQAAGLAEID